MNRRSALGLLMLTVGPIHMHGQEINTYRVINVTLKTSAPAQLAINRGRLIWRDTDLNSGKLLFKYFWGQDIVVLDSNLTGVTSAINGDHIVWNTSGELVRAFDCRTWITTQIGQSYNPDHAQAVDLSNDLAVYARRNAGGGTKIAVHRFSTANDTLLSGALWNTSPSVHHGQVAWVVSDSESSTAASNIFFFDGTKSNNISNTSGIRNRSPILRDGQIAWLQTSGNTARVKLFTGDTTLTIAQAGPGSMIVTGYDLSDGVAIAALKDTATGRGSITIYISETGTATTLIDSSGVTSAHISSGLVAWQSGLLANKKVRTYSVQGSVFRDIAAAENPVIDQDIIAWTLGDAVEMARPVTYRQLTTDGMNGWEQTKFKTIDSARVVWGNFANSSHSRLFLWDGIATRQLTDSTLTRDLIMANDGYVIWRHDFDSMYYCDGTHAPVRFVDTVQAENPYVSGGFIGFSGLRLPENKNIRHAWLYDIGARSLAQLTTDSSNTANVMCNGKKVCWLNTDRLQLMFNDGITTIQLSDSLAGFKYSYTGGKLVWSERRSGIMQIMMYDDVAKTKTQLTSGPGDKTSPVTDGRFVVWYAIGVPVGNQYSADMWYYDMTTGQSVLVPHATYQNISWNWMSNGKIAWTSSGNLYVFDGSVVTQMTGDDFDVNTSAYLDRGILAWSKSPPPPSGTNGDIFTGKLHAHASFDAAGISGAAPITVAFTNRSWEGAVSYSWDFGDGGSSTAVNPSHTYTAPGKYSVTLTAAGPAGTVTERKYRLIRASSTTSAGPFAGTEPLRAELFQNFPNPFNPSTSIRYRIGAALWVRLEVYDILGRRVTTLVDGLRSAGEHSVSWDASRNASGVYFYRLEAGSYIQMRKMMVIK
jgi:PKD repeat protein